MSALAFREYCESKGWFDRWGRYNADRKEPTLEPASNNNLLYHAEYIAVLDLYGEITEADGKSVELMFRLHQERPGQLKRDPMSGMQQKHDDIIGAACMAALVGRHDLAREIVEHLRANDWIINVLDPESGYAIDLDISRIGGVEQIMAMCAKEDLGLYSQAILGISMVLTAYLNDGESGVLMKWLVYRTFKKVCTGHFLLRFFMSWFESRMKKDPLAMGSRFARYFPVNGAMNPLAMYTMGRV